MQPDNLLTPPVEQNIPIKKRSILKYWVIIINILFVINLVTLFFVMRFIDSQWFTASLLLTIGILPALSAAAAILLFYWNYVLAITAIALNAIYFPRLIKTPIPKGIVVVFIVLLNGTIYFILSGMYQGRIIGH